MATAGILTLDLHGKTVFQAQVAIDAQLRRAKAGVYRLRLIHGSHQGTALRDMIRQDFSHPRVKAILPSLNPGETRLLLQ